MMTAMPRVLQHRTKAEMLASLSVPVADKHGPLPALDHLQQSLQQRGGNMRNATIDLYDDASLMKQLAGDARRTADLKLDARRSELVRILRRHNYSMPGLVGQAIQAQVG